MLRCDAFYKRPLNRIPNVPAARCYCAKTRTTPCAPAGFAKVHYYYYYYFADSIKISPTQSFWRTNRLGGRPSYHSNDAQHVVFCSTGRRAQSIFSTTVYHESVCRRDDTMFPAQYLRFYRPLRLKLTYGSVAIGTLYS